MKFLFWQNMISIHQTALLNALASKHQVTLAVQRAFEEERTDSGWKIPDMGNVHLELSPDEHILPEEEFHRHTMLVIFLFCHAEAAPTESHRRAQRGLPAAKT